jgi:hypothetical protein
MSDNIDQALCIVRGHFLQRSIELEMRINLFLSRYFGRTEELKDDLFYHLFITNRITFDAKVELFTIIIENYHPEFKIDNPNYLKNLKEIIEHRNNFAHLHLDITESGENAVMAGKIALAKYNKKDLTKTIQYNQDEINGYIDMIYNYIDAIDKFINVNDL